MHTEVREEKSGLQMLKTAACVTKTVLSETKSYLGRLNLADSCSFPEKLHIAILEFYIIYIP